VSGAIRLLRACACVQPKVYDYISFCNLFIIRVLLPTTMPTWYPEDGGGIFLRSIAMTYQTMRYQNPEPPRHYFCILFAKNVQMDV
jgi:hypothetical protein